MDESKGTTKYHEDGKWKREGKVVTTHSYGNPRNTTEEGELLFIVVPYPIRYCTHAVTMERQQLQQQQ